MESHLNITPLRDDRHRKIHENKHFLVANSRLEDDQMQGLSIPDLFYVHVVKKCNIKIENLENLPAM
jgi:hypothetical protein